MKKRLFSLALCLGLCCLLLCPAALADDGSALPDTPPATTDSAATEQNVPAESSGEQSASGTGESAAPGEAQIAQPAEAQSPASDAPEDAQAASILPGPGQVIELDDTPDAGETTDSPGVSATEEAKDETEEQTDAAGETECATEEPTSRQQAAQTAQTAASRVVLVIIPAALVLALAGFALVRRKKKG